MKTKIIAVLAALPMLLGIGLTTAAPANADVSANSSMSAKRTHTCVDNYEYNHFYIGNRIGPVERFFDTYGWVVWRSGNVLVKKYYHCGYYYDIVKVKYYWNGYTWIVHNAWRY